MELRKIDILYCGTVDTPGFFRPILLTTKKEFSKPR